MPGTLSESQCNCVQEPFGILPLGEAPEILPPLVLPVPSACYQLCPGFLL